MHKHYCDFGGIITHLTFIIFITLQAMQSSDLCGSHGLRLLIMKEIMIRDKCSCMIR